MDGIANIVRCPTRCVLKQADAADGAVIAQVEPVLSPGWYAD